MSHTREYAQAKANHWMEQALHHTREAERHEQLADQALDKYIEWNQKKNDTSTDEELHARVKGGWSRSRTVHRPRRTLMTQIGNGLRYKKRKKMTSEQQARRG
jgi:hypothetical protein